MWPKQFVYKSKIKQMIKKHFFSQISAIYFDRYTNPYKICTKLISSKGYLTTASGQLTCFLLLWSYNSHDTLASRWSLSDKWQYDNEFENGRDILHMRTFLYVCIPDYICSHERNSSGVFSKIHSQTHRLADKAPAKLLLLGWLGMTQSRW